jgi:hypothetical protein
LVARAHIGEHVVGMRSLEEPQTLLAQLRMIAPQIHQPSVALVTVVGIRPAQHGPSVVRARTQPRPRPQYRAGAGRARSAAWSRPVACARPRRSCSRGSPAHVSFHRDRPASRDRRGRRQQRDERSQKREPGPMTVAGPGHELGSLTEMHHEIALIAPNCRSVFSIRGRACALPVESRLRSRLRTNRRAWRLGLGRVDSMLPLFCKAP